MGHSNGLITPPVNTADVSYVTRRSSNDVGTLCGNNPMINMWAKYKPVIRANTIDTTVINGIVQINNDKTWKSTATWWKGDISSSVSMIDQTSGWVLSTSCGITIRGYFGVLRIFVDNWDSNGWKYFWHYNPPTGGLAAPYRLIDFNYYYHEALPPMRDFEAPREIIRYTYGSETVITGQASVWWPEGGTTYQLTIDDLQVRNGAGFMDLSAYYFGVVMVKVKDASGADISSANRTYGIITSAYKWNETVQPAGAAPQDVRYTQLIPESFFLGSGFGTYRMYPVLSKAKYNGTEPVSYSTIVGSDDYPIYPLHFNPIDSIYHDQDVYIRLTAVLTRVGTGSLNITITATNITNVARTIDRSLISYYFTVYPKDSQGSTDYQNLRRYPQEPGVFTWGTGEVTIQPNSSWSETTPNPISYTDSNYGAYINARIDYGLGAVAGCSATLEY